MKCGGYVQQYHEFENFQIDFSKKKKNASFGRKQYEENLKPLLD